MSPSKKKPGAMFLVTQAIRTPPFHRAAMFAREDLTVENLAAVFDEGYVEVYEARYDAPPTMAPDPRFVPNPDDKTQKPPPQVIRSGADGFDWVKTLTISPQAPAVVHGLVSLKDTTVRRKKPKAG